METKINLKVLGLTNSQIQSGAYALILAEDGPRRLPVIVGVSEAQSIAIALEGLQPARPLTHDLFTRFARTFRIHLQEVFIYKSEGGIFFSKMVFSDGTRAVQIDSRTSDAVAIALRMKCDICTTEAIMQQCGVVIGENAPEDDSETALQTQSDPEKTDDRGQLTEWLQIMQKNEIGERMEQAIREENYEFAKLCSEELQRREKEEGE
ncbi:MAG: bifunctional nuclease family protein [Tannerella sp.]|nr:bifunctional nuclease family protein [Tannerella sp.]